MLNKTKWIVLLVLLLSLVIGVWFFINFGGRSASRILGKSAREVIKLPDMQQMVGNVNMWFDSKANITVKDITFCSTDGYYYTYEYRELNPFEGVIRWVPHDRRSSIIRSRLLSRLGLSAVDLAVPKDFSGLYGVTVVAKEDQRVKNLTYLTKEGRILIKEYRDGLAQRLLGGYLEVRGAGKAVTQQTPCDRTYLARESK